MHRDRILVLGGTGKSGRRLVTRLRDAGHDVLAPTRRTTPRFDWHDRGTWSEALAGVTALYLVPLDGELLTRPFVEEAVARGVTRVVLLSGRGVDVPGYVPDADAGRTHIDGEAAVRALDVPWTVLRPTWFSQNFTEGVFRDMVDRGDLRLPAGDGAVPFVDASDIAAVAAAALTDDVHSGRTYELSGPRSLTMAEAAAELSAAAGREIRYTPLSVDRFVAEVTAEGWSGEDARLFADALSPVREDREDYLSTGVRDALGREPRDFTAFATGR